MTRQRPATTPQTDGRPTERPNDRRRKGARLASSWSRPDPVALVVGLALLLIGCGGPAPTGLHRLKPGSEAMVGPIPEADRSEGSLVAFFPDPPAIGTRIVREGTKVRVLVDPVSTDGPDTKLQLVRVLILEGDQTGTVGTITRPYLTPMP